MHHIFFYYLFRVYQCIDDEVLIYKKQFSWLTSVGARITIRIIKATYLRTPKMIFKGYIILMFAITSLMFNNLTSITERTIGDFNNILYINILNYYIYIMFYIKGFIVLKKHIQIIFEII